MVVGGVGEVVGASAVGVVFGLWKDLVVGFVYGVFLFGFGR